MAAQTGAEQTDQIAYCCLASSGVLALGLQDVVSGWNQASEKPQITGLLMWDGRLMIHWLEASRSVVDALWSQVQGDVRQHCLVLLKHERGIKKRLFAQWHMQSTSRNEMMAIVREARDAFSQSNEDQTAHPQGESLQHAISTLSILLNPELAPFYAPAPEQRADAGISVQQLALQTLQNLLPHLPLEPLPDQSPPEAKRA